MKFRTKTSTYDLSTDGNGEFCLTKFSVDAGKASGVGVGRKFTGNTVGLTHIGCLFIGDMQTSPVRTADELSELKRWLKGYGVLESLLSTPDYREENLMPEPKQTIAICPVCHRNHNTEMPCPRRIASAITMQPMALENLTQADKDWLSTHKQPQVVDLLEEAISDTL